MDEEAEHMTTGSYLVVGHSAGLGAVVAEKLVNAGARVVGISRTRRGSEDSRITHFYKSIEEMDKGYVLSLLKKIGKLKGVIFCQRYRQESDKESDPLREYAVSVVSVGVFIDAIAELNGIDDSAESECTNIVLVGSSCAKSIGREQGWSYHASKHALRGLMKWACLQTSGNISVNLLNPATYMREGSEEYWRKTARNQEWVSATGQGLFCIAEIAELAVYILCQRTNVLNGMEFDVDRGMRWLQRDSQ